MYFTAQAIAANCWRSRLPALPDAPHHPMAMSFHTHAYPAAIGRLVITGSPEEIPTTAVPISRPRAARLAAMRATCAYAAIAAPCQPPREPPPRAPPPCPPPLYPPAGAPPAEAPPAEPPPPEPPPPPAAAPPCAQTGPALTKSANAAIQMIFVIFGIAGTPIGPRSPLGQRISARRIANITTHINGSRWLKV